MKKALLAGLITFASPSFAAGYVGLGFGQARVDIDTNEFTTNEDDSDTSFRIFGGIELNQNFAAELGYVDFGTAGQTQAGLLTDGTYYYDAVDEIEVDGSAFYVAAVGKLPLGRTAEVFGKFGLARWSAKITDNIAADVYDGGFNYIETIYGTETENESGIDPVFGVGFSVDATDQFSIRGEYEKFKDVGEDDTTGQSDVDVVSLSGIFRF